MKKLFEFYKKDKLLDLDLNQQEKLCKLQRFYYLGQELQLEILFF